ncbi:MAG: S8 family serine peptidase, partial [Phycisphaeraceae bacterium]|nr:S8 family serine peptidase [Phycisphaeraceae bacterium]
MSSIFRVSGAHARRSAASIARASGAPFERATIDTLEQRVLLSAVEPFVGPLPASAKGQVGVVEFVAWRGAAVEAKTGSWILTFDQQLGRDGAIEAAQRVAEAMGLDDATFGAIGKGRYATIDSPTRPSHWTIASAQRSFEGLLAIEPNLIYQPMRVPNDPLFTNQWGLDNTGQFINSGFFTGFGTPGADISAVAAWDVTIGSRDVIVAVIDTGVDIDHPDLAANIWRNPNETPNGQDDDGNGFVDDLYGWDFGELNNDPRDLDGHGTGAAGIIGAVGNNGIGITGVAWDVSILPIKVADRFGNLSASAIVAAHEYLTMMITDYGHNIVASNNSYGAFAPSFYLDEFPEGLFSERSAIEAFIAAGGTFVASAGNDANDNDANFTSFPASYPIPGLISVAATAPDDSLAIFSNYGAQTVDLAAPGVAPGSLAPGGGTQPFGGTSAAAPFVVG